MKILIASLILLTMIVSVLFYYHRETQEAEIQAQTETRSLDDRLKQFNDDSSRDSAQLVREKETRHLLFKLDYSKERAEKYIVNKWDSAYLFGNIYGPDDVRWYKQFRKRYHPSLQ